MDCFVYVKLYFMFVMDVTEMVGVTVSSEENCFLKDAKGEIKIGSM